MFGYITPNINDLTEEDKLRYKKYYCGLCKAIEENYSSSFTVILSYDFTFLYMLLVDLYNELEIEKTETCITHPIKKRTYISTKLSSYVADMQVVLAYYSLLDNLKDKDKKANKIMLKKIEKYMPELKVKYKRQVEAIENCLALLDESEKNDSRDIDKVFTTAGLLTAELFAPYEDLWHDKLFSIGLGLGRYIYLLDAWDDIDKDIKNNSYNPLKDIYKDENYKENVKDKMDWALSGATTALEQLPLDDNLKLLRNIIYSGLWQRFEGKKKDE